MTRHSMPGTASGRLAVPVAPGGGTATGSRQGAGWTETEGQVAPLFGRIMGLYHIVHFSTSWPPQALKKALCGRSPGSKFRLPRNPRSRGRRLFSTLLETPRAALQKNSNQGPFLHWQGPAQGPYGELFSYKGLGLHNSDSEFYITPTRKLKISLSSKFEASSLSP